MQIDILCTDGSPLGVGLSTVYGDEFRPGVGGAELALLSMCEVWHNLGHTVRLYNEPSPKVTSPFEQLPSSAFTPSDKRDVIIVFRSPNPRVVAAEGLKVWWSTDQYTVGDFEAFAPLVDRIVCISPFHQQYFEKTYGIRKTITIDLPVRIPDYDLPVKKVKHRFIFTSIPDRGLHNLWRLWHKSGVLRIVPDASLVITSDYRLWGCSSPQNDQHKARWLVRDNIEFLSCVSRRRLVEEQLRAEFHLYPSNYEELFCIAVAESQVAGAYPITSGTGALTTTNMGTVIQANADDPRNDKLFLDAVEQSVKKNDINELRAKALDRFDPIGISKQWDEKVFT